MKRKFNPLIATIMKDVMKVFQEQPDRYVFETQFVNDVYTKELVGAAFIMLKWAGILNRINDNPKTYELNLF